MYLYNNVLVDVSYSVCKLWLLTEWMTRSIWSVSVEFELNYVGRRSRSVIAIGLLIEEKTAAINTGGEGKKISGIISILTNNVEWPRIER